MPRRLRWLVPASVASVVAVGALAPGASADLPAKSPDEVLVLAQQADVEAFSGTVQVRTDLGIPAALLSDGGPGGPMGGDGDRTVRIWRDGDEQLRLSVAETMNETTLVRDGDEVWVWDSADATVIRSTVPEGHGDMDDSVPPADPTEVARAVLDAVGPTTEVSSGEPVVVAGREAYELVLIPTQAGTLVGEVTLAVDAATGAVLGVEVTAVGQGEPAVDIAFTDFDPTPPPADVFDVTIPPGSTVEDVPPPDGKPEDGANPGGPRPEVVGEAWTSVLVLPAGAVPADEAVAGLPPGVLEPVAGGAVLRTALASVLLADDGRVLLGAVTPEVLVAAAGE